MFLLLLGTLLFLNFLPWWLLMYRFCLFFLIQGQISKKVRFFTLVKLCLSSLLFIGHLLSFEQIYAQSVPLFFFYLLIWVKNLRFKLTILLILFILSFIHLLYFGVLRLLDKRCQILCRYSLIFQLLNQIPLHLIFNLDKWWFLSNWSFRKKNAIILSCFDWDFFRFSLFRFTHNWRTKAKTFSGSLCD